MRIQIQFAAIETSGDPARLQEALEAEIAVMEAGRDPIPWQGGLPDPTLESLEPYRERLEETYDPFTGILELAIDEDDHPFTFHVD